MTRFPNLQLARQWQERLKRFDESELTIAQFCEIEGYSPASFYQWRRKLAAEGAPDAPTFVPVDLQSSDLQGQGSEGHHPGSIQVELPGGALVSIPGGAALPDWRNLIQAVVEVTAEVTS
jgi:hypothetical protein